MPVESEQIEPYLERILVSAEFARSERMVRFLQFIVRETLSSKGLEIKERTIGIEVFDRPADWDPKTDTIVRSEARRLRRKLESYYQSAGSADPFRIEIPKGGYVPEFQVVEPLSLDSPRSAVVAPAAPTRRASLTGAGALLGFAVCVALLGYALRSRDRGASDTFREVPFATAYGQEFSPSISPDGKSIAYVWDGDGSNFDIYVKPVEGGAPVRFTSDPAPDLHPAWSPDGKSIAFLRWASGSCDVILKPVHGGSERAVARIRTDMGNWTDSASPLLGSPGPEWTPDGKTLILSDQAAPEESRLIQVAVETGQVRELTKPAGRIHDFYPRVSPDGRSVAFARYFSHGLAEVFAMPLDTLRPAQLTSENRTIGGLSWTPDGRNIVFASDRQGSFQLWEIGPSGGKPRRLPSGTSSATDVAVAPSGDWLSYVSTTTNSNIWRAKLAGGSLETPERFIASSGRNHTPRYSPDGRQIVFVSDRSGSWEIWLCDAAGSRMRQLTHFQGPFLGGMSWSPDSKRFAFDARPSGHAAIFVQNIDGGEPSMLEKNAFEERVPSWSRDGKSIYFSSDRDGSIAIWKRSLADNSVKRIGRAPSFASAEALDGTAVYYQLMSGELIRAKPDGADSRSVSPEVWVSPSPNWALGRSGIYYTSQDTQSGFGIYLFSGEHTRLLWTSTRPVVMGTPSMSVSPDEEWLLFAEQDHSSSDIYIRKGRL